MLCHRFGCLGWRFDRLENCLYKTRASLVVQRTWEPDWKSWWLWKPGRWDGRTRGDRPRELRGGA